jgi:hypothetical protein
LSMRIMPATASPLPSRETAPCRLGADGARIERYKDRALASTLRQVSETV